MDKSEKKKELIRSIKFLLFSISAGLIQMSSFALFKELLHWPNWLSYLLALVLSVLWNFTLNRKFTFKSANNVPIAMLKVACYYAVFTPLSTLLERTLADTLGWGRYAGLERLSRHSHQHGPEFRDGIPLPALLRFSRLDRHQRPGPEGTR